MVLTTIYVGLEEEMGDMCTGSPSEVCMNLSHPFLHAYIRVTSCECNMKFHPLHEDLHADCLAYHFFAMIALEGYVTAMYART